MGTGESGECFSYEVLVDPPGCFNGNFFLRCSILQAVISVFRKPWKGKLSVSFQLYFANCKYFGKVGKIPK